MLKYKHIEAMREARLWIGQIIIPAIGVSLAFPQTRQWIGDRWSELKDKVSRIGKRVG